MSDEFGDIGNLFGYDPYDPLGMEEYLKKKKEEESLNILGNMPFEGSLGVQEPGPIPTGPGRVIGESISAAPEPSFTQKATDWISNLFGMDPDEVATKAAIDTINRRETMAQEQKQFMEDIGKEGFFAARIPGANPEVRTPLDAIVGLASSFPGAMGPGPNMASMDVISGMRGNRASFLRGERAKPITSETRQSEPVSDIGMEAAFPKERPEITNPEDLVSTPHETQAKEAFSTYVDDIKARVAEITGQEHIKDAAVKYEPGSGSARYNIETNSIYIDPAILFKEPAARVAETAFHELSHGGEFARHTQGVIKPTGEMIPGPKHPVAEMRGEIPLGELPESVASAVVDAGNLPSKAELARELGITEAELGALPESTSLTEAQLGEGGRTAYVNPDIIPHYTENMALREQAGGVNESVFMNAFRSALNDPANYGRRKAFENEIAGIQKAARTAELAQIGEKPARSYEEVLADIQAGRELPVEERGTPKAKDIEREALTQYALEQDARVKEAGRRFSEAKTNAEKSIASKEFQEAKAERDRVQARITQLGGGEVRAKAKPQEVAKQVTEPEPTPKTATEKVEEKIPTPQTEVVVSAPAHNLRRLLEGMGLTRFNINKLPETLKAAGLEVTPELEARLPELVGELKERGWVNEKIGGTYTLQTSPPKGIVKGKLADVTNVTEQLKKSVGARATEEIRNEGPLATEPVEELTPAQIREQKRQAYAESKGIDLERRMPEEKPPEDIEIDLSTIDKAIEAPPGTPKKGEPLTPDEIKAIAKLFGEETKPRKGTKETPQEVLDAQKAALRGLVEREKKGGEGLPPTEEVGEGPSRMYDVTLSDGTTHKVKASTPEEAKTRAEGVLTEYNSTKKVDKVEPSLSTLEKAAKYEIEPVKEATEQLADQAKEIKGEQKAEIKQAKELGKEEEKLRTAQRKEEFEKQPYTVNLSNGRVTTVWARNEKVARELVESRIKAKKSGVTIQGITEKPTALDQAITGASRKLEESGFLENPVVKVLNAVKSITFGGDVGHLLRQGKQINADLLFSKHAKKVLQQFPELWKLAKGGMKSLEDLNDRLYKDPDIRTMVDDFGMDMPGMGKGLKEEAFHGAGFAEKLPVIGKHYVERSEAVYTGGLNYLRAAEAKKWIESLKKDGFTPDNAPEKYAAVARAVNIISQRGQFNPAWQKLFSDASAVFGAPRAKAARLQNAVELFRGGESGRIVRSTAAKTLGFNLGLFGLLKAVTGATFITDPESSDFGKIRINKKITVDPWMGLGVTARTVAKLAEGKAKSPYKTTKKGEAYEYPVKPSDALSQEFLGGIAPGVKLAWEMFSGTDLRGFQVDRVKSLGNVAPLTWKSIVELAEAGDIDEALELSMLQAAGEGVDVFDYEQAQAEQRRLKLERGLSVGRKKGRRVYPF